MLRFAGLKHQEAAMHRRDFLSLVVVLILLADTGMTARAQAPALGPQGNPQVQPEFRRLAFLLGQWQEEIMYAGQEAGADKGRGRWLARPEMGLCLVVRYEGSGPEGDYRAMGVLTWDQEAKAYRMWWFDDGGGIGEYRGDFRDDGSLALEHHGKSNGQDFRERITYARVAPGEVRTKIEQSYGGEEYKVYLEAVAHRVEGQRRPGGPPKRPDPPN